MQVGNFYCLSTQYLYASCYGFSGIAKYDLSWLLQYATGYIESTVILDTSTMQRHDTNVSLKTITTEASALDGPFYVINEYNEDNISHHEILAVSTTGSVSLVVADSFIDQACSGIVTGLVKTGNFIYFILNTGYPDTTINSSIGRYDILKNEFSIIVTIENEFVRELILNTEGNLITAGHNGIYEIPLL